MKATKIAVLLLYCTLHLSNMLFFVLFITERSVLFCSELELVEHALCSVTQGQEDRKICTHTWSPAWEVHDVSFATK